MRIVRAEYAGACFGVQRALDLARKALESGVSASTMGSLIHNPVVVGQLEAQGLRACEAVEDITTPAVIIRSHGVTPEIRSHVASRGLEIIDATCPFVSRAQHAASKLGAKEGMVLVVGEEGHPEVVALQAYAEQAGARVLVCADAAHLPDAMPERVGIVVQTTQTQAALRGIVEELEQRGTVLDVADTICEATAQRQEATVRLASTVDAMIVLGGRNSANTSRLAQICREHCPRTYHIETAGELNPAWLEECETVGVTAGASTPEEQIVELERALESLQGSEWGER